jgi:hypothetical protein
VALVAINCAVYAMVVRRARRVPAVDEGAR